MGQKRATQFKPIEQLALRNVTYCKRKRGFIKKAMELAKLCIQDISVVMYDKRKNKVVTYNSNGFSLAHAKELVDEHIRTRNRKFESYTCKDYDYFVVNQEIAENEGGPGLIFKVENMSQAHQDRLDDMEKRLKIEAEMQETH